MNKQGLKYRICNDNMNIMQNVRLSGLEFTGKALIKISKNLLALFTGCAIIRSLINLLVNKAKT